MMNHTLGIQMYLKMKDFAVVQLRTTLEECHTAILERRKAVGSDRTDFSKDIEETITRANNYAFKLYEIGCKRIKATREETPSVIL